MQSRITCRAGDGPEPVILLSRNLAPEDIGMQGSNWGPPAGKQLAHSRCPTHQAAVQTVTFFDWKHYSENGVRYYDQLAKSGCLYSAGLGEASYSVVLG